MRKAIAQGIKLILTGLTSLILVYLLMLKGPEVAPIFESVGAEIFTVSVLFTLATLMVIAGISTIRDDWRKERKRRLKTF